MVAVRSVSMKLFTGKMIYWPSPRIKPCLRQRVLPRHAAQNRSRHRLNQSGIFSEGVIHAPQHNQTAIPCPTKRFHSTNTPRGQVNLRLVIRTKRSSSALTGYPLPICTRASAHAVLNLQYRSGTCCVLRRPWSGYIAASALRSRVSASRAILGYRLTPILAAEIKILAFNAHRQAGFL